MSIRILGVIALERAAGSMDVTGLLRATGTVVVAPVSLLCTLFDTLVLSP